jgi:hypothetical protein
MLVDAVYISATRTSGPEVAEPLERIVVQLAKANERLAEMQFQLVAQDIRRRLDEVRARLADLEEKVASSSNQGFNLENIGKAIQAVGGGVAKLITAYEKANVLAVPEAIITVGRGFAELRTSLQPEQFNAGDLDGLKQAANRLEASYSALVVELADTKRKLLNDQYTALSKAIEARATVRSRIDARLDHVRDLSRLIIILYHLDLSQSIETVDGNRDNLLVYLKEYPRADVAFALRALGNLECPSDAAAAAAAGCIDVPANEKWQLVEGRVGQTHPVLLPLYVLAPHTKKIALRTLGMTNDVLNLDSPR